MSYQRRNTRKTFQGSFYVTEDCLACESCQDAAPNNFRYVENGFSFVFKQPDSPEEVERCQQAVDRCPLPVLIAVGV